MRRIIVGFALSTLLIAGPTAAADQAREESERAYPVRALYKLGRGITNVVLSPTEIYINMFKETYAAEALPHNNWADIGVGSAVGFAEGIGYMFARIGVGVADIVSFPVPTRPFMQPKTPNMMLESEELRDLTRSSDRVARN